MMKFLENSQFINWKRLILLFSVMVILSACWGGSEGETATPTAIPTATQASVENTPTSSAESTPETQAADVSPLATPESPLDTPIARSAPEVAKPEAGKASLQGRVMARFGNATEYQPVVLSAVYLAPVIENGVAALDSAVDPSSGTNPEGYFVFDNVRPGTYGFVVYYNVSHYLIRDETGKQLVITLDADEIKDIGEVRTALPED